MNMPNRASPNHRRSGFARLAGLTTESGFLGVRMREIIHQPPANVYKRNCQECLKLYHRGVKISGIALPDLHVQVVYFGSRRFDRAVRRQTTPLPCWALQWNRTRTATIRFEGNLWRLGPDVMSLAAPRTVAAETMRLGEEHTYLHFMLGPRYDRVESQVLVLPAVGAIGLYDEVVRVPLFPRGRKSSWR